MWQNINLSGFGLVRWWQDDRKSYHIWPQSWVPALPLAPLREWPTWPRPGKWHKWALQPIIYHWYYFQGPSAVLYLHHLITYSCKKCREMLYCFLSSPIYSYPLREWPTWPRPGKWHKWALQPIIYHWYYFQGPSAVLYLHHLITYSCKKCREMLYCFLSSPIYSFHCQPDVLLYQGTTFKELLL